LEKVASLFTLNSVLIFLSISPDNPVQDCQGLVSLKEAFEIYSLNFKIWSD
jgi:hypothetical protein